MYSKSNEYPDSLHSAAKHKVGKHSGTPRTWAIDMAVLTNKPRPTNYSPGGRGQISGAPGTSLGSSDLLISTTRNPHLRMPAQTKSTRKTPSAVGVNRLATGPQEPL